MSKYTDAYIITKVIKDSEGQLKLDILFQTYHQMIIFNNINHYSNLNDEMLGQDVLAYIRVKNEDEEEVKKFSGYIGKHWKHITKKIDKFWNITKEEGLKTVDDDFKESLYEGLDKDELFCIHPNLEKLDEKKEK